MTDEAIIKIKAGDGGDGRVSFHREKFVSKGGPDGGDGGKGGDVYFVCDNAVHTLGDYARKKIWQAENGENGKTKRRTGKNGQDLILKVPPGTIVRISGGQSQDEVNNVIADFMKIGESLLITRGGKGGWGNVHFATATRQSPVFAKKGTPGQERTLKLELKLIADVGLIGLPNSGKSTLLSRISNARPKIADYPFTTLEPNLGVAKYQDKEFVVADIPGLIEGASQGKGLGDKFLRHIERTKILVHLVDINPHTNDSLVVGVNSQNLERDYQTIRDELRNWNPLLLEKKEIVVLNKADTMPEKESQKIAKDLSKKIKKDVLVISAVSGKGIDKVLRELIK